MSVFNCGVQMLAGGGGQQVRKDHSLGYVWASAETGSVHFEYTGENQAFVAIFSARANSGRIVNSVTFNGVAGTKVVERNQNGTNDTTVSMWIWVASELPTSSGTKTLTATWSSGPTNSTTGVYSLSHVNQTIPTSDPNSSGLTSIGSGSTINIAISNSISKFIIAAYGVANGSQTDNASIASPMSEDYDLNASGNGGSVGAHDLDCQSNSETYTWTANKSQQAPCCVIAAINAE